MTRATEAAAASQAGASRRQVLAGSGALIVSFSLPSCANAQALDSAPPASVIPPARPVDAQTIGGWLRIDADSTVTVYTGKAELGQGLAAPLAQIAADELGVPFDSVTVVTADTGRTPDEGYTFGSISIQQSGSAIRFAAAEAALALRQIAAERWQVAADSVTLGGGIVSAGARSASIGELVSDDIHTRTVSREAATKPHKDYRLVGSSSGRPEIPAIVFGEPHFLSDMRLPGMVFGRVVRPPSLTARLLRCDTASTAGRQHVLTVVRDGSFLGVVATTEEAAIAAAQDLSRAAEWTDEQPVESGADIAVFMDRYAQDQSVLVTRSADTEPYPDQNTFSARFTRPFHAHASIGPSAAAALWEGGELTVWSHTQGAYPLRNAIAKIFELPHQQVRVIHSPGSGCYGHNGADDAAADAARLAQAVPGRPVMLQWSRQDEFQWEPYGSAMLMDVSARLTADGKVTDWAFDVTGFGFGNRPQVGPEPSPGNILFANHRANAVAPPPAFNIPQPVGGLDRNAIPLYDFPGLEVRENFIAERPVRTSALRALGAYANVMAIESMMDEMAEAAGADPIAFRLAHLSDERGRAVLERLADALAARRPDEGTARGFGFAQYENLGAYYAVAVDLRVDQATGEITLDRMTGVVDCGLVINPDGVRNQIEGGAIQSASWTLFEEAQFAGSKSSARDWATYPILTLTQTPEIETIILDRSELPALGVGEVAHGPVAGAIANAVYGACGVRMRDLPFTKGKLRAALER